MPAWEQDLEGTMERGGRVQDKEKIMERLRELGYMWEGHSRFACFSRNRVESTETVRPRETAH